MAATYELFSRECQGVCVVVKRHVKNRPQCSLVSLEHFLYHELLTSMDAFSRYNKIRITSKDREYISFITDRGTYCYRVMPFRLKTMRATYQKMVNKMFKHQIERNVKAYIDDMIVKSKIIDSHLADLAETFQVLKKFNIHLNLTKCIFGVNSGKFLIFIMHRRG